MSNTNPTVLLNGDQIYLDELIRENARLTVQHEADRTVIEELTEKMSVMETQECVAKEAKKLKSELDSVRDYYSRAVKDLHAIMAGGDPCDFCLNKCPMGTTKCTPEWHGSRGRR